MTPNPIAFYIGSWPVHWYGILFAVAVIVGSFVAMSEARRRGEDPEIVWDALLLVLIFGVVGGRLYHVIHEWNELYKNNPISVLYIWNGGLGLYGGVAGGALALFIYARRRGISFLRWADIAAPGLVLGQAIGRWGNFFNQELYGPPSNLPWAIPIEPQYRLPGYEGFERFQPLFLYESLWNLFVFGVLMWVARRSKFRLLDGDILSLYLIGYSAGRVVLESIKLGPVWKIAGLPTAQLIGVGLIIVCGAFIAYRHRQPVAEQAVEQTPAQ